VKCHCYTHTVRDEKVLGRSEPVHGNTKGVHGENTDDHGYYGTLVGRTFCVKRADEVWERHRRNKLGIAVEKFGEISGRLYFTEEK